MKKTQLLSMWKEILSAVIPDVLLSSIDITKNEPITCISIGKAAEAMYMALVKNSQISVKRAYLITKYGHIFNTHNQAEIMESGHPYHDMNSIKAGKHLIETVQSCLTEEPIVFLISGGASALVEYLPKEIDANEYFSWIKKLLCSGANIEEINTVRKAFSMIKGGQILSYCQSKYQFCALISDVVNKEPDCIGSGLTFHWEYSFAEVQRILMRYHLTIPHVWEAFLQTRQFSKSTIPIHNTVLSSVSDLVRSAVRVWEEHGYKVVIMNPCWQSSLSELYDEIVEQIQNESSPLHTVWLWAGEPTVRVEGEGKGGRCQHLALLLTEKIKQTNWHFAALASDGTDGSTDKAGAYVMGKTWQEHTGLVSFTQAVKQFDSGSYLETCNATVSTGPTGTNVNDLYCLWREKN